MSTKEEIIQALQENYPYLLSEPFRRNDATGTQPAAEVGLLKIGVTMLMCWPCLTRACQAWQKR